MPFPKDPPYTDPSTLELDQTLARELIPLSDDLRDMFTQFGLRPYKVRVVRVQWSEGERGVGTPLLIPGGSTDILPTPKMTDLNGLTEIVNPIGVDEVGAIIVSQISGRITENELMGLDPQTKTIPIDQEVFWEIEFISISGQPNELRRFQMRSAPQYYAGKFQWVVRLERSRENRALNGTPDP